MQINLAEHVMWYFQLNDTYSTEMHFTHTESTATIFYITVTSQWARRRLQSPASRLFTQPFIQAQIKEKIKAPRHWTLCGELTGEFPHKGPVTRIMFTFDDVIITSTI